jgi:hypothetical protein
VGFEPTTSAMPMPYPTGLDDRPTGRELRFYKDINTLSIRAKNALRGVLRKKMLSFNFVLQLQLECAKDLHRIMF